MPPCHPAYRVAYAQVVEIALRKAQSAVSNREGKLLTPAQAASVLGYTDVSANFWMNEGDTWVEGDDGRRPVTYTASQCLPKDADVLDYGALRAFSSGGPKGWGVTCTQPIRRGQIIGEACGR